MTHSFPLVQKDDVLRPALITALLLIIPLLGNMYVDGWNWSPFDFVWAGLLIFGTGFTYKLVAQKTKPTAYRAATALGLATAFSLVWINAAVGIIGEDNGTNLIYFCALAIGLLTVFASQLQPRGMARAMFITALSVACVPIFALVAGIEDFRPGVPQVFLMNSVFALLLVGSGLLFKRASSTPSRTTRNGLWTN